MEIIIESMMLAERCEFLDHAEGNKGNGFHHGRALGQGRILEVRIPRDRYGNFHPKILATVLLNRLLYKCKLIQHRARATGCRAGKPFLMDKLMEVCKKEKLTLQLLYGCY